MQYPSHIESQYNSDSAYRRPYRSSSYDIRWWRCILTHFQALIENGEIQDIGEDNKV